MPRNTFISITQVTRDRFAQLKKDCSEHPECNDDAFLNELMDDIEKYLDTLED